MYINCISSSFYIFYIKCSLFILIYLLIELFIHFKLFCTSIFKEFWMILISSSLCIHIFLFSFSIVSFTFYFTKTLKRWFNALMWVINAKIWSLCIDGSMLYTHSFNKKSHTIGNLVCNYAWKKWKHVSIFLNLCKNITYFIHVES